jgi:hypothetical protein
MIFLKNVDNKAFQRITVLIWIHPYKVAGKIRETITGYPIQASLYLE